MASKLYHNRAFKKKKTYWLKNDDFFFLLKMKKTSFQSMKEVFQWRQRPLVSNGLEQGQQTMTCGLHQAHHLFLCGQWAKNGFSIF